MATLYSQAASNVRKTWLLFSAFLVIVIAVGWYLSVIFHSPWILIAAVIWSILNSFASYWYSDKIVLALTKAKPLQKKDNQLLYRVVENLAITAGLPMPRIYVMEEEQPNAFATGRDEEHAVITVTRGLLEKLDKAELEGVIAHEMSHIKDKDILLQTVVVVFVGTISIITDIMVRLWFFGGMGGGDNEKGSQAEALMFLLMLVFLLLAWLASLLLKAAISRKREFLADANGALLTRYPEGLARALEKIGKDRTPLKRTFSSTAHLFIASPFRRGSRKMNFLSRMFMTHPPIEKRIEALRQMSV